MKICNKCGEEKCLDNFYGRNKVCKSCYLARCKNIYYPANKEKLIKGVQDNIKTRRDYVIDFLLANPCNVCGEPDPVVLVFDHLIPDDQTANISFLITSGTKEKLELEIEKCQVLCCNCHARRTAAQQNWMKLKCMEP